MIYLKKVLMADVVFLVIVGVFVGCASTEPTKPQSPAGIISEENAADWGTIVRQEKYYIVNNVWNKGAANEPGNQKVFVETLDGKEAFGWQWSWSALWSVVAYPEVIYGNSPWDESSRTKTEFPFIVGKKNISVDFDISLKATGIYNMAFSLWAVTDPLSPKSTISHEIMIWNVNHYMFPAGAAVDSIVVGGVNYKMYFVNGHRDSSGSSSQMWTYIAFVSDRPVLKGTLDFNTFTDYLIKKGILTQNNYITNVELGNEVVRGTGIVEIKYYHVNVK